jgi:hypothetical protein
MNYDFDSLYKIIEKMDQSSKEKCLICHLPIENDELILSCNHYYHSKCLNKKTNKLKCPYCQKIVSIKPTKIISEYCKILLTRGSNKGEYCGRINCCYHKLNKETITVIKPNEYLCQSILKSGLRKGEICGRNNCKLHNINL